MHYKLHILKMLPTVFLFLPSSLLPFLSSFPPLPLPLPFPPVLMFYSFQNLYLLSSVRIKEWLEVKEEILECNSFFFFLEYNS